MDIDFIENKTLSEFFKLLDEDFALHGETDKKCPICGNGFEKVESSSSYTIKCKTDNCIKNAYKGI